MRWTVAILLAGALASAGGAWAADVPAASVPVYAVPVESWSAHYLHATDHVGSNAGSDARSDDLHGDFDRFTCTTCGGRFANTAMFRAALYRGRSGPRFSTRVAAMTFPPRPLDVPAICCDDRPLDR